MALLPFVPGTPAGCREWIGREQADISAERLNTMGYAFISYSSRNLDDALAMRSVLMNRGIKTWMAPGDIPAGSTYAGVITRAIKSAECLVLLLTDDSQNSKWVDKEVERALSYGRTVIPVALDELVLNDNFEFYLGNQQIVPVKQISDDNDEFLRIVDQIVKLTGVEAEEEGGSANAGLRNTGNRTRVKSLTPYIPLHTGSGPYRPR